MPRLVAVTGATGFVGSHLVRRLASSGWSIRILTRRMPTAALTPNTTLDLVLGDLDDGDALRRLVSGVDAVVHVAGIVKARHPQDFQRINAQGTRNLVDALSTAAPRNRLIHISSLAAREPQLSPYAASKRAGEDIVAAIADRQPVTILRPPAIYGPGDREILPMFQAASRGLCPYPGPKAMRVSLIHVADLAAAIAAALERPALPERLYEVDDGHPGGYDWAEIAGALSAAIGRPVRRLRIPRSVMAGVAGLAELRRALGGEITVLGFAKLPELYHQDWATHGPRLEGWKAGFDLESGFRDTVAWYARRHWLRASR
jgi:nucleoside-diphosphate-sugar epimerase